jgi:hypothetical protein
MKRDVLFRVNLSLFMGLLPAQQDGHAKAWHGGQASLHSLAMTWTYKYNYFFK